MTEQPTLERALERLDEIAIRLESGDLELDDALALYEEGIRLLRLADAALGAAEQRIQQITPDGEGYRLQPLEHE
jgi:exodeoxyribonuclease VII small subunit